MTLARYQISAYILLAVDLRDYNALIASAATRVLVPQIHALLLPTFDCQRPVVTFSHVVIVVWQ